MVPCLLSMTHRLWCLVFLIYIRPVLSSSKALGLTARSLHQCCREQCSHAMNRVPRGENVGLCLQVILVHGSAVGTATPKQPKFNLLHIYSRKVDVTVVMEMLSQI